MYFIVLVELFGDEQNLMSEFVHVQNVTRRRRKRKSGKEAVKKAPLAASA